MFLSREKEIENLTKKMFSIYNLREKHSVSVLEVVIYSLRVQLMALQTQAVFRTKPETQSIEMHI